MRLVALSESPADEAAIRRDFDQTHAWTGEELLDAGDLHADLSSWYIITEQPPRHVILSQGVGCGVRGGWATTSHYSEGEDSTAESCQEWAAWLAGQAWGTEAAPGLKLPRQCGSGDPSVIACC